MPPRQRHPSLAGARSAQVAGTTGSRRSSAVVLPAVGPEERVPGSVERRARHGEWLTTREASALVGVSSATLRRWCDAGAVTAFTTPGGHRRLARSAVLGLLTETKHAAPATARLDTATRRITGIYRREIISSTGWPAWVGALPEPDRQALRARGRRLAAALVGYLGATAPEDRQACLRDAESAAADHGRIAAAHGSPMGETVELFLRARAPFLREIAALSRREALTTTQATGLLEAAIVALDRLLSAVIEGHRRASAPGGRPTGGIRSDRSRVSRMGSGDRSGAGSPRRPWPVG